MPVGAEGHGADVAGVRGRRAAEETRIIFGHFVLVYRLQIYCS